MTQTKTGFSQADAHRIAHHLQSLLLMRNLTQETRQAIEDAIEVSKDLVVAQCVVHDMREDGGKRLFGLGYHSEVFYVSDLLQEVIDTGLDHVRQRRGRNTYPFIKEIPFREYAQDGQLWVRARTLYRVRFVEGVGAMYYSHKEYVEKFLQGGPA